MSLSIALITADPPRRVATILEPLRPYAEEIVIAADSRLDEATLGGYGSIADRLFRIEYRATERHLAWLCAQCRGEWILRLDGDEVPSAAFVRRLPEMLSSRTVQQYWTSVAWLYRDPGHMLTGPPWSENFGSRLVRNDGTLRVRGVPHLHMEPIAPREYLEEPFYHLNLLTSSQQERRDKVILYETSRQGLIAPGGGRMNEAFYLPELRDSLDLRPVPAEDLPLIARALDPAWGPGDGQTHTTQAPFVSLLQMDRAWEGRAVGAGAYRARIEPLEPACSMAPSEQRTVFFRVSNRGSELWPAGLEMEPPIRVAYRWLHPDGGVHTPEGLRSPFPRPVAPGEQILMPVHVAAPSGSGEYVLEVDVVHEHVRWFECACRLPVRVARPGDLPPDGARLRETPPPRLQRRRAVRIPPTIHRVWLGGGDMPAEHERFGATFAAHHPDWEMRLWTDEDLPALDVTDDVRARARTLSGLSNLVRYEVLHRFGGVYVDTDVECLRALTPLLRGIDAFAALESPGVVGTAVLGSVAHHPMFARAARLARRTLGVGAHPRDANGPHLVTLILEQEPTVAVFGSGVFYPYSWTELERRQDTFPDAYAVHHWAMSWLTHAHDVDGQRVHDEVLGGEASVFATRIADAQG